MFFTIFNCYRKIEIEDRKIANYVLKMVYFIRILKDCKSNKMYGKTEEEYKMMT